MLLGDVCIWAVHCLDVLPERAWVCVAFGAAWDLADVGFLGREGGIDDEWGMEADSGGAPTALKLPHAQHGWKALDLSIVSAFWRESCQSQACRKPALFLCPCKWSEDFRP